ncbi:MAG: alkaline phosphatase family protein, partial [Sedimentisphaerales bacterium]|nr:alkaline phosphatase family protein [Sedimentisphaerales bacterium]
AAGEDTLVLVVSDHGFGTLKHAVALNVWLKNHGYLKLLPEKKICLWKRIKQKVRPLKLMAVSYGNIKKRFKKAGATPLFGVIDLEHMRQIIDFDNTQALCVGGMAGILYITEKNMDKRNALAEKIRREMLDELGPGSELPVIKNIKSGAEVYSINTESTPDLVIEYFEGIESRRSPKGQTVIINREENGRENGTHRRNGIWAAYGKDIKPGTNADKQIVDITPTVLAYLGLEIPKHIDGKSLTEIFKDPPELKYEDFRFDRSKAVKYTNDEQAEVEKQLADLGYL